MEDMNTASSAPSRSNDDFQRLLLWLNSQETRTWRTVRTPSDVTASARYPEIHEERSQVECVAG